MSQQPPAFSSGFTRKDGLYPAPPRQRLSKAAVVALIWGLLIPVPAVTGIAAIVAGVMAIRATRDPMVYGRRFAVVGLVLGCVNLVAWGVIGNWWVEALPVRRVANAFVDDLAHGRAGQATQECTNDVTPEQIEGIINQFGNWGSMESAWIPWWGAAVRNENGVQFASVNGFAGFPKNKTTVHPFEIELIRVGDTWRVRSYKFE